MNIYFLDQSTYTTPSPNYEFFPIVCPDRCLGYDQLDCEYYCVLEQVFTSIASKNGALKLYAAYSKHFKFISTLLNLKTQIGAQLAFIYYYPESTKKLADMFMCGFKRITFTSYDHVISETDATESQSLGGCRSKLYLCLIAGKHTGTKHVSIPFEEANWQNAFDSDTHIVGPYMLENPSSDELIREQLAYQLMCVFGISNVQIICDARYHNRQSDCQPFSIPTLGYTLYIDMPDTCPLYASDIWSIQTADDAEKNQTAEDEHLHHADEDVSDASNFDTLTSLQDYLDEKDNKAYILATVDAYTKDHQFVTETPANMSTRKIRGQEFESIVAMCFKADGYNVELTPGSGDFGADIIAEKDDEKTIIQCKRYNEKKADIHAVNATLGGMVHYNGTHGVIVTNGTGFTTAAKEQTQCTESMFLMDYADIVEKLHHNEPLLNIKNIPVSSAQPNPSMQSAS